MMTQEQYKSGITTFEVNNGIGILTINNGMQNKISEPEFLELDSLKQWLSQEDIKGLIITGKGRHFSAGADVDYIKECKNNPSVLGEKLTKGRAILNYIETLPIVTVAAISGVCFGAGLEIALSCQFRIGASNALLALPESNLGIMPGLTGTIRLPKKIGKTKALEMIITGKTVPADEALELGLVDKVVPNKNHVSAATQFIEELTENKTQLQINSIIQSVNNAIYETEEQAMIKELEMFLELVKDINI